MSVENSDCEVVGEKRNLTKPWLVKRFAPTVTKAEIILHQAMAKEDLHFKSQWRIKTANGHFCVDFLVEEVLVVEVKGSSHVGKTQERNDSWKTLELINTGYPVLWFDNIEVYKKLSLVLDEIKRNLELIKHGQPCLQRMH